MWRVSFGPRAMVRTPSEAHSVDARPESLANMPGPEGPGRQRSHECEEDALPRELNILVVANRTARSADLEDAMRARAQECPARFTLVIPAGRGLQGRRAVDDMGTHMRQLGLDV